MSDPTFDEIAAKHGEDAAIRAGIAADPDTMELDEEWFSKARPVRKALLILLKRSGAWAPAPEAARKAKGAR